MIILASAINYNRNAVRNFFTSLMNTGYSGKLVVISNDCDASSWLESHGIDIIDADLNGYSINSSRYKIYKDYLKDVDDDIILTDIRDVIFQSNPEDNMPTDGVNVFQEDIRMTIGSCPYNSSWMSNITDKWNDKQIICSGITSGHSKDILEYCNKMWDRLKDLPNISGLDQAVHNDLVYSGKIKANIHTNNNNYVYTLGYCLQGTVEIESGDIKNKDVVPCMIHQYDRHDNLMKVINHRYIEKEIA